MGYCRHDMPEDSCLDCHPRKQEVQIAGNLHNGSALNEGTHWSGWEEEYAIQCFREGQATKKTNAETEERLAKALGRSPNAVRMKLERLLPEYVREDYP